MALGAQSTLTLATYCPCHGVKIRGTSGLSALLMALNKSQGVLGSLCWVNFTLFGVKITTVFAKLLQEVFAQLSLTPATEGQRALIG